MTANDILRGNLKGFGMLFYWCFILSLSLVSAGFVMDIGFYLSGAETAADRIPWILAGMGAWAAIIVVGVIPLKRVMGVQRND